VFARLTPVLAAAALLTCAAPALADQYTVTTTAPGSSSCTGTSPAWTCPTLEGAVNRANELDIEDEIVLQAPGTYHLSAPLTLSDDLTIVGQGARVTQIDGNEQFRVLDVLPGVTASIINVTIQNGNADGAAGGNIRNAGDLTVGLTRVTGGEAGTGGGIANAPGGLLAVLYSLVDGNAASVTGGGGIATTGSVDGTPAHVDIADSTIAANVATTGAGILVNGTSSDATIQYATIARNIGGGGIAIANANDEVDISASLLAANNGGNCPSATKPIDEQYNLDDASTCGLDDPTSKTNADPVLSAQLVNAGGGTDVYTFDATSPAVDMVAECVSFFDQRPFQRVAQFGQACDAGAYEQSATGPAQPTISSGPPATTTDTSASFAFSAAGDGSSFVCQLTGPGQAGGYQPCTSPATYTGLAPGDYVFAVAIADPTGQAPSSPPSVRAFTVAAPAAQTPVPTPAPSPTPAPAPAPQPQKDATGKATGTVLVKLPGGRFAPLDPSKPIPDGAEIDATKGRITLTAVLKKGGKPETATFYDGIFKLKLGKKTTDLVLSQPLAPCGKKAGAAAKKPKTRKLWGNGSGSFRTRGQYSAATVRGTQWLVQDSCAGTLTQVKKGVVSVFDQVKKRTIVLRAGKRYLAQPRR
jgi:hypothetical protein